jgi:hypothetical protein
MTGNSARKKNSGCFLSGYARAESAEKEKSALRVLKPGFAWL